MCNLYMIRGKLNLFITSVDDLDVDTIIIGQYLKAAFNNTIWVIKEHIALQSDQNSLNKKSLAIRTEGAPP